MSKYKFSLPENTTSDEEDFFTDDKYKFFYYSRLKKNVATKFITKDNKYIFLSDRTKYLEEIKEIYEKEDKYNEVAASGTRYKFIYASSPSVLKTNAISEFEREIPTFINHLCIAASFDNPSENAALRYNEALNYLYKILDKIEIANEILKEQNIDFVSRLRNYVWDSMTIESYYYLMCDSNIYGIDPEVYKVLTDPNTRIEKLLEYLPENKALFNEGRLALRNANMTPSAVWTYASIVPLIVANNPSSLVHLLEFATEPRNLFLQVFEAKF